MLVLTFHNVASGAFRPLYRPTPWCAYSRAPALPQPTSPRPLRLPLRKHMLTWPCTWQPSWASLIRHDWTSFQKRLHLRQLHSSAQSHQFSFFSLRRLVRIIHHHSPKKNKNDPASRESANPILLCLFFLRRWFWTSLLCLRHLQHFSGHFLFDCVFLEEDSLSGCPL